MSITHLIFQAKHLINTSTINMIKKTHLLFFFFSKIVLNYTLFLHLYIFYCKILSVTIGKLNYSSIYNHNTI